MKLKSLISILALFTSATSYALPDLNDLSQKQMSNVKAAKQIAESDGHSTPSILPAIILKESNAGERKQNGPNLGIAQITLQTALAVLSVHPELGNFSSNVVLKHKLLNDDIFNMKVASKYLMLVKRNSIAGTITAYNLGPSGAKRVNPLSHPYTISIMKTSRQIQHLF